MLTCVEIKNYRSCANVRIENLGAIVGLVGRNSAGKSNILKAIQWAARCATHHLYIDPVPFVVPPRAAAQISVALELSLNGTDYKYTVKTLSRRNIPDYNVGFEESLFKKAGESKRWTTLLQRKQGSVIVGNDEMKISRSAPSIKAFLAVFPETKSANDISKVDAYLERVKYYPLDEPTDMRQESGWIEHAKFARWFTHREKARQSRPNEDVEMRILAMKLNYPDKLKVFESLIGSGSLGLIDKIQVETITPPPRSSGEKNNKLHLIIYRPHGEGERYCSFADLSSGTRRLLRILVSMVFDESSTMLLEQPEDGIHAGLLCKLLPLLRANAEGSQMIFASHSAHIFNELTLPEVRLVAMKDGDTEARSLSKKEITAAKSYMRDEGLLYDFLELVLDAE